MPTTPHDPSLTEKFFVLSQSGAQVILVILVLLSIFSLCAILERWYTLSKIKSRSHKIRLRIRDALAANNYDDIEEMSRDKETVEGRALGYGLRHVKQSGSGGLEAVFSTYAMTERPQLEKFLTFLASVGSNGPFIGLLGTVFGIMKAFNDLSASQNEAAQSVMRGIAEALVSTAVGLIVAIPAVIAYNYFQKQVKQTLQGIEMVRDLCVVYANQKGK